MVILRRLKAAAWTVRAALYVHEHQWDPNCRTYGQYRYRICLLGCGAKKAC